MTAPDPRVGEIEAREALVHIKCADCAKCRVAEEECWCPECEYWGCERGPDCEDDPNPTDVAFLLAELRKAHEALARVESDAAVEDAAKAIHNAGDWDIPWTGDDWRADCARLEARKALRAAVAAAKGDERG